MLSLFSLFLALLPFLRIFEDGVCLDRLMRRGLRRNDGSNLRQIPEFALARAGTYEESSYSEFKMEVGPAEGID